MREPIHIPAAIIRWPLLIIGGYIRYLFLTPAVVAYVITLAFSLMFILIGITESVPENVLALIFRTIGVPENGTFKSTWGIQDIMGFYLTTSLIFYMLGSLIELITNIRLQTSDAARLKFVAVSSLVLPVISLLYLYISLPGAPVGQLLFINFLFAGLAIFFSWLYLKVNQLVNNAISIFTTD